MSSLINSLLFIFNYMWKCTSCINNTRLENPGPALPCYLRLLFICVLQFYLRFTFLFAFYFSICVLLLTLLFTFFPFFKICVLFFSRVFSFLFVFDPSGPPYDRPYQCGEPFLSTCSLTLNRTH